MSMTRARRPRIPSAFIPPDWPNVSAPSGLVTSAGTIDTGTLIAFSASSSPKPSVCSIVAPPSDVFASPQGVAHEYKAEHTSARSIRTALRELKERKAAVRRSKALESVSAGLSCAHTPTPVLQQFIDVPTISTILNASISDTACLRSTLRQLQERHAARRQHAEDVARLLAAEHELKMLQICREEERAYSGRWSMLARPHGLCLCFSQVPWPLLTPIINTPADISVRGVERFLLSPFRKPHMTPLEKIEEELERWAQDSFEKNVMGQVWEAHREDVRSGAERIRAALKELLQRID